MLQHYFTYTHRLTWHGLWIILLSIIVLGLITKLVNLRIISPPALGSHLKNPERSMPFLSNELRVGTYNIRYGKGYETPTTINQLAEVLASPALDIIAMNEVQKPVFSETSQAEHIADLLDMSWLYAMTADRYLAGRAGNALLSRYHVTHFAASPLIHESWENGESNVSKSPRNVIFSLLDNGQKKIAIIATHLDRGPLRIKQLEQVLAMFDQHEYAILLGDLNSSPDQAEISHRLTSGAVDAVCAFQQKCEWHIDWILTKGFEVLENGSYPIGLSDHPQYWARLKIIDDPPKLVESPKASVKQTSEPT